MADPDVTYRGYDNKLLEWQATQWSAEDNKSINETSIDIADNDASILSSSPEKGPKRRVGDKIPWLRALMDFEPTKLDQWKNKRARIADLKDELYNLRKELVLLENEMNEIKDSDDLDDYL